MEAGFLQFDPASEFEILESIDFEEQIQRPESLRFFTLDEQLTDYFDKVLPKKGKVTKFEYNRIAQEVDRLREIYEDVITITDTDYVVDLSRKKIDVNWVSPIYSDFKLTPYSYATNWNPLYKPGTRSVANYYPRMLAALPKPYKSTGAGVPFSESGFLVNEEGQNPIGVLGTYERTKGVIHEDGSFSVIKLPVSNTSDDVKVKGFFIDKRPLEIPNPLASHPFLASNEPTKLLTEEPLNRVFPTIETIMTHGVPTTPYPYTEGKKFLKLYDVKLSQVSWDLWKERFPPVDTISATPEIQSIAFSLPSDETAPSKSLLDTYVLPWYAGMEPRLWLASQEDNGALVMKMLLSQAGKAGLVPPALLGEKPLAASTPSTPEECFIVENFDAFLNSGVYRSSGHCIPVAQIVQERNDARTAGKIAWRETTDAEILKDHQSLLKYYQFKEPNPKPVTYEKYAGQPQSDLRRQILAILNDPERDPIDKADAIEKLLRGSTIREEVYFDGTDSFLICGHTLAMLKGDLEQDKDTYYEKWTAIDEGSRSCKFCGEQVSKDVLVAQDDFDEDGNAMVNYDTLQSSTFHGESHVASFTNSLNKLKSSFILENPGEAILYLLLSLMQVLPTESQLLPVVQNIRELTAVLRMNKKIEKVAKERTEGILGIAGMVILLQSHNPFLIPRRSFGSKILKLSGFPRDTDDVSDSPVLDIVISILKTTFESSPNTFKGPITTLLRQAISKPKDVRKESVLFLKQAAQKFKTQLVAAKERYEAPAENISTGQLSLPVVRMEKESYKPDEKIGEEERMAECQIPMPRTYLMAKLPPSVVQDPIILSPTKPSPFATFIEPEYTPPTIISFTDAELRRRAGLGFPKGTKLDKLEAFIRSDTDGISLLSLLNRVLDILSREGFSLERLAEYRRSGVYLRTTEDKSIVRDSARGLLYELFHEITKEKNKTGYLSALNTATQRDLVLSMILLTREQATKQDSDLRTREREVFKQRMRQMNDTEREVTKMLLDIGIAPYIITNEDREIFAKEYNLPDPEEEYNRIINGDDIDRPEEGYNAERDVEDDQAAIVNGIEQQVDYGDYGDRREEIEGRDYERNYWTNLDEDYGV